MRSQYTLNLMHIFIYLETAYQFAATLYPHQRLKLLKIVYVYTHILNAFNSIDRGGGGVIISNIIINISSSWITCINCISSITN